MSKDKKPTVSGLLDQTERKLRKDNQELGSERDPLSLTEQNKNELLVLEQEKGDMLAALKDPAVRRVLYRVMMMGGLHDSDSDPNPVIMAHHTGRRSLALDLYKAIKSVDGGAFYQMEREHESNKKSQEKLNVQ
jgi:hypothetical protein